MYDNFDDSRKGIGLNFGDLNQKLFVSSELTIEEFDSDADLVEDRKDEDEKTTLSLLEIVEA